MHCALAGEGVAAEPEARGQAGVGRLEMGERVERAFERAHPRQAEAEALEPWIEFVTAAGRQPLQRTTHCLAFGTQQHGVGVEPEHAQRGRGAGGALIGKAGHAFHEGELTGFDRSQ